ncbi:hypothetical protein KFK14_23705 [Sphingobium phenoxybenzoativorans]|uniref:Phosphoribosyltransferase domain-containing protein n=1 Tax=Sphingobium phenoxybenzoativorans TaxID=1592790 RepID=A0A975K7G5_9SPHN|nr:hypothetical protein [Sphingobium phenoxybenzoativorans]QUT05897.1 hypothetical protein KFK14_23705 [Sphingobium phenoxybenzoativorans]
MTGFGIGLGSNVTARPETPLMLAARLMLRAIRAAGYEEGATIVPVPSGTHTRPGSDFVGGRIARVIEIRDPNFASAPLLHFARSVPRTAAGRRRTETALRVNLRASAMIPSKRRVILLDDVMTTGAHLRAAAGFLAERGIRVDDAFVVARQAVNCPENMFNVPVLDL